MAQSVTTEPPQKLPIQHLDWGAFVTLIGQANAEIARYDGILQSIPNPALLLSPLLRQEAVLSSRIEGTQATLKEVLQFEAKPEQRTPKRDDIREVVNYRIALETGAKKLEQIPLSLRLIREIHEILLRDVRDQSRNRGVFRKIQNFIGAPGEKIENARYVPPGPDKLMDYLSNFEKYLHYEEKDRLVQAAIMHGQFEIIHPFIDGNGRVGRLLIPLFLYAKKVLYRPMFYISAYFEQNRTEYYDRLLWVTQNNDWSGWIQFFLMAVIQQSKVNIRKAQKILSLYDDMKERIPEITRSQFSTQTIDVLFNNLIFTTKTFKEQSAIPKTSVHRILRSLTEAGIINVLAPSSGRSPTVFIFPQLFQIAEEIEQTE